MKKMILMAVAMLASVASFAQHAVGTVTIQPKVGLNVATLTDGSDVDPRIGAVAGAEFEYQATDIFSISAGALYSMQGAKADNATMKLDYINIPILANVYVVKGLAVKLGIQPGFNVNSEFSGKSSGVEASVNFSDYTKTFDFSIPVGVSYEFSNIVLDARYNWGLTKWSDTSKMSTALGKEIESKSKNSVFQFTVGYKFAL